MNKKGLFISIEGTDGSGKSTQIKLIKEFFNEQGYDILMLREPGGTIVGEKIRELLLDVKNEGMTEETEMLLYAAARAQLVKTVIKPAIAEGKIVICDRFVDSSLVYQGIGRNLGIQNVLDVNKHAVMGLMPHLTLFLEVDPAIAFKRRENESKADRVEMEGLEFQKKVFSAYKEIGKMFEERIKIIDGTQSVDEVFKSIKYWLIKLIKDYECTQK